MNTKKFHLAGETALLLVLLINSLAVDLMSKSGFGISTISSVPLIFSTAFPFLTFGTWNYIFQTLPCTFVAGFALMCFGICLANNCMLPIIPTDTFPRDLSEILSQKYKVIKTTFDLTCLTTTVVLSLTILHRFYGIGFGTVFCAFVTGKGVSLVQKFFDKHVEFYRVTGRKHVVVGRNVRHA